MNTCKILGNMVETCKKDVKKCWKMAVLRLSFIGRIYILYPIIGIINYKTRALFQASENKIKLMILLDITREITLFEIPLRSNVFH